MIPAPSSEAVAIAKNTRLTAIHVIPSSNDISADQSLDVKVRFAIAGGLYEVYNRDTWQNAYAKHDTMLRIIYKVGLYRKTTGLLSRTIVRPIKFVRKGKLYWTRNPDLTDNTENRIWSFVVDEEGLPRIFDKEIDVKNALFSFERILTVPAESLRTGKNSILARVSAEWYRHTYIGKGNLHGTSKPVDIIVH
ncbi:MAG: hypothetical protein QXQ39_02575 [Conexivisphaerales archaeon]